MQGVRLLVGVAWHRDESSYAENPAQADYVLLRACCVPRPMQARPLCARAKPHTRPPCAELIPAASIAQLARQTHAEGSIVVATERWGH